MPPANREVYLVSRPGRNSPASEANFGVRECDPPTIPPPGNSIVIKTLYLSVDPAQRCQLNDSTGVDYLKPHQIGERINGLGGVGVVVAAGPDCTRFSVGDVITTSTCLYWPWAELFTANEEEGFAKIDSGVAPELALTYLGLVGLTSYLGIKEKGKVKAGDVVVISGAAGACGTLAGQFARLDGAEKVIGICGSDDKRFYICDELGFTDAVNYKEVDFDEKLAQACKDGVDVYFDNVAWKDVGRLEVGTETIIDKSKSIKSVLLQLWDKYDPGGERDIEGCDSINACYGGTAALFNAVDWVHSPEWDGRYALVVMGDIAVYGPGNCRPTSGAGAVAMIVGPDAPLVMEQGTRSTHAENAYDFYKPNLHSAYPIVDSALSVDCYSKAVDKCYALFCSKSEKRYPASAGCSLSSIDHMVFHCPYVKLTQKGFARMAFSDFLRSGADGVPELEQFRHLKLEETYGNRDVMKAATACSAAEYLAKAEPSTRLSADTGNMYTASLYACLCSLIVHTDANSLAGKRIGMFSYGSGFVASMFALRATTDIGALRKLASLLEDVPKRLESRTRQFPEYFNGALDYREKIAHQAPFKPEHPPADLLPGSWYLVEVDEKHRRRYARVE